MERVPAHATGDYREPTAKAADAGVFLIEYRDGFQAAVAMLNGWLYEGDGGAFTFAGRLKDQDKPAATLFYLQQPDPFAHFAYLVQAIDSMMQTGHSAVPGGADAADDGHPRRGHDERGGEEPARSRRRIWRSSTSRSTGRSPRTRCRRRSSGGNGRSVEWLGVRKGAIHGVRRRRI